MLLLSAVLSAECTSFDDVIVSLNLRVACLLNKKRVKGREHVVSDDDDGIGTFLLYIYIYIYILYC